MHLLSSPWPLLLLRRASLTPARPIAPLSSRRSYDHGIDIWSVGCILAECLGRKALLPGRDYLQQLRLIIETLGAPAPENLKFIENPQAVEYIQNLPKKAAVPFKTLYPNANAHAIDLLEKMLVFNPNGPCAFEDTTLATPLPDAFAGRPSHKFCCCPTAAYSLAAHCWRLSTRSQCSSLVLLHFHRHATILHL